MKIVLDCSAAVGITMHDIEAVSSRRSFCYDAPEVLAPTLFFAEVGSSFAKYVKAGAMDEKLALRHIEATIDLVDTMVPIEELYLEAFCEALRWGHSIYDMLYFVLARRHGARLVTLDKRLTSICEQAGVNCIHEFDVSELLAQQNGKGEPGAVDAGDGGPGSTVSS